MAKDFEEYIKSLVDDTRIDSDAKKGLLDNWKQKLIKHNSNRMMDKEDAEKHFEWLAIIEAATVRITEAKP